VIAQPRPENQKKLREIGERLAQCLTIALASHVRPDGDAIGSVVALGDALRRAGKTVTILNQDGVPDRYQFLPDTASVKLPASLDGPLEVDAFIALDTSDAKRLGDSVWAAVKQETLIVIDHHVSNPGFGDLNYIDVESPATGQIVFDLIQEMGWELSPTARDHLWVAIVTDTGSFQYPNTTDRTLEIGAELVRLGVDVGRLSARIYQGYPYRRLQLLRELLNSMQLCCGGRVASWKMRREALDRLQIMPEDTEGLIDQLRSIDGVIAAVSFEEATPELVRISARSKSKDVDVAALCGKFGGGGHVLAAGASVMGTVDSVAEQFLKVVCETIEHGND